MPVPLIAAVPLAAEALAASTAVAAAPAVAAAAAAAPAVASTVAPTLAATGLKGLVAGMPAWAKWAGLTAGGMSGIDDPELAGLLRRPSRSMTSLLMDEEFTDQLANVAKSFKKAERARSPRSSELDGIIAGNEAALAQIQSERILSPMELIQMIESMNG